VDCAVNLLPRAFVNFHVVFFATVLLDLGHDLRFAIAADLPFTVFWSNVRAAETNFILAMFFAKINRVLARSEWPVRLKLDWHRSAIRD